MMQNVFDASQSWFRFTRSVKSPITRRYQEVDVKRFMGFIGCKDSDELAWLPRERI
jgi:hypothetical protein